MTLTVTWTNGLVGNQAALELIQSQVKKAGIDLQLKQLDQPSFIDAFNSSNFDFTWSGRLGGDGDIMRTYFSTGLSNIFKLPATGLDGLLTQQAAEAAPTTRTELIKQIQADIVDNLYVIPVVEATTVVGVSADVHDVVLDSGSRLRLQDAWKS